MSYMVVNLTSKAAFAALSFDGCMKNQLILLRFAGHDVEDHAVGGTHGIGADDGQVAYRQRPRRSRGTPSYLRGGVI